MQIFVRTDRTHVLHLAADATGKDVKEALQRRCGIDAESAYLTHGGRLLVEGRRLDSEGVSDDSTLYAHLRLLGGAKKRKKKNYTKPKKLKHKHKSVKLRMLKVYKVDDSGKVQRLRKQCPRCGPGIFMATHFDRVYCGKCTLTYLYENATD
ncbi:unnamed protein product [Ostreobium quekettii]|uniref:Ubiquitin-like domain-containing protein n=1 Tax=Ostreobium quekettii TaxID=121088 RepID=A0A8S1ITR7_9CHLO|nr:unnamed protein product [Ostreobium quekettii]